MASCSQLKRKHLSLTIQNKVEILNRLGNGESGSSLAKVFGVGKATISDIKKKRNDILTFAAKVDSDNGSKLRKTLRSANDKSLEDAVYLWFTQRRSLGEPVSGPLISEKALYFNEKLGGSADFKASTGWLKNFKARHGIRELNFQGECLLSDSSVADDFQRKFLDFVKESGFAKQDVYNCNNTGINWKAMPEKSLAFHQEKAANGFKISTQHIRVMVCANASGEHALPLLVIGKSKNPRCFNNAKKLPLIYRAQKSAWMNSEIFTDWFKDVFIPNVKSYRKEKELEGKILLIMDNAPTHPSIEVLNLIDKDFQVMFLPPNVAPMIQPMDQGVIEMLKSMYRKQVLQRLFFAEDNAESIVQFSKELNLEDASYMLADSWDLLTRENLTKAWNKLWPDSTESKEDNKNERETTEPIQDVTKVCQAILGFKDCDETDTAKWLNIDENNQGYEMFNVNDIVSLGQASEDQEGNDSEDNDKTCADAAPSHADAFRALETVMAWYESQPESTQAHLLLLNQMKDLAGKNRVSRLTQPKITDFFK